MNSGREKFIARAVAVFTALVIGLTLFGVAAEHATARFGGLIWLALIPAVIATFFGVAAAWAGAADFLDWRAVRASRPDPDRPLPDGATVAVSGQIRCPNGALESPLFGQPCAAFMTRITGQRRSLSSSGSGYRSQLCTLEFALAEAFLDSGKQRLRLLALPDVGIEFRSTAQGGDIGEKAMQRIGWLESHGAPNDEANAEGRLITARTRVRPPLLERLFVANTETTSNPVSVLEDSVPVDTPVTILARHRAVRDELTGERRGGMKVFAGDYEACLIRLQKEWVRTAGLSVLLLLGGTALMTCGYWWPA
jgi:hypothetical protein